jgi:hypothetical protein
LSDAKVKKFGKPENLWQISDEDVLRQATASLRGYIYQLHQSAAAWINLADDEILLLEVAEDITKLLNTPDKQDQILQATQIKDTRGSGAVTLNTTDVIDAIKALFRYQKENLGRKVRLVFLTTSEIGSERKNPLPSKTKGLIAWQEAAAGGDVTEIRNALLKRIDESDLRTFIESSPPELFREKFLASLHFISGAKNWESM